MAVIPLMGLGAAAGWLFIMLLRSESQRSVIDFMIILAFLGGYFVWLGHADTNPEPAARYAFPLITAFIGGIIALDKLDKDKT